jgi:hypothetical protein
VLLGHGPNKALNVLRIVCLVYIFYTRQVSIVEQELLTLPEHMSSPPIFGGVRVTRSLVLCVLFCRSLFKKVDYTEWV